MERKQRQQRSVCRSLTDEERCIYNYCSSNFMAQIQIVYWPDVKQYKVCGWVLEEDTARRKLLCKIMEGDLREWAKGQGIFPQEKDLAEYEAEYYDREWPTLHSAVLYLLARLRQPKLGPGAWAF